MKDIISFIYNRLFSTTAAGVYILLFAISIAVATFIENDFGTSAAQKVIFQATWFEALLILFALCVLANIYRFRMYQNRKWASLTFHLSFLIILLGSAITRYYGYEGVMHIRENDQSSSFLSAEMYLSFDARANGLSYQFEEPVLFASLGNNDFEKSYEIDGKVLKIRAHNFIPNPIQQFGEDETGLATLKIVIGGANGREEYFLQQGKSLGVRGNTFSFSPRLLPNSVQFRYEENNLMVKFPSIATQMVMATQEKDTLAPNEWHFLRMRSLYALENGSFVIGDFLPKAKVFFESEGPKMKGESIGAIEIEAEYDGLQTSTYVLGRKGIPGNGRVMNLGDLQMKVAYGAKSRVVPFSLKLRDFQLEKYPGTNSASSYASEVTLIDPSENVNRDFRIYMNNILTYRGYRFFQSSFDPDELGTYLSVNHDFWGTWVSYLGYFLLTLGLIMTFFLRNSRFTEVRMKLKQLRASRLAIILLLTMGVMPTFGQEVTPNLPTVDKAHAQLFSEIVVQDHRGRLKPFQTMASEILRKVARTDEIHGYTAEQVILGMMLYPDTWAKVPIIKLGNHDNIKSIFGDKKRASYADFFNESGQYILRDAARNAHGAQPIDRGVFEKEVIKIDERLNIINLCLNNTMVRLFPLPNDENNRWISAKEVERIPEARQTGFLVNFFPAYRSTITKAIDNNDWGLANELLNELTEFQLNEGSDVFPSKSRVNAELLLNKLRVFKRLALIYALLGIGLIFGFFTSVLKGSVQWENILLKVGFYILAAAFLFHTIGLGLRWYVSGHAPWTNGYESMIYIAWTTVLAGMIFSRKNTGAMAATAFLAATILFVAGLNWLDPEITPLVPVLKSYWLMIHVSLEAGSYGFLMLGAIIGIVNLLLYSLMSKSNASRLQNNIKELTYLSELTLMGGLVMISVGTYLGGIWANESWGRYWGWDAKETWALVTILVYAFILHMRFIPGLKSAYSFNVASLFGFASVMMTYFGVNYYLSGLHSYAAGDPAPIPVFVYWVALFFVVVSVLAYWRKNRALN